MAYCQPNPELRDRLLTDLDIKGLNACPDKVDISAIRCVYDMSDPTKQELRTVQPFLVAPTPPLTGLINVPIWICNQLGQRLRYEELLCVFAQCELDAAGRALLAVAGDEIRIHLRFNDGSVPIYIEIGNSAWQATASPGVIMSCVAGTHIHSIGAAASAYPAANLFEMLLPSPIKFRHTVGGYLNVAFECTNGFGFPANTWITVNAIYSFK